MDDDDYYPPERVSHAVETLQKNPQALCAGSSEMYFYFKHIQKMYTFGPYGPNHSTAATFAFRKELLLQTSFDETASVAEEKKFLKGYTIPFVQLDSKKSILVFSHIHNSYDKKTMLETPSNYIHESKVKVEEIVKESNMRKFFMEDIDSILELYEPGKLENKPDVIEHMEKIKREREAAMKKNAEDMEKVEAYKKMVNQSQTNNNKYEIKINDMMILIQDLTKENSLLKDRIKQLENK